MKNTSGNVSKLSKPVERMRSRVRMALDAIGRIQGFLDDKDESSAACAYIDDQAHKAIKWLADVRAIAVSLKDIADDVGELGSHWHPDDVIELAPVEEPNETNGGAA